VGLIIRLQKSENVVMLERRVVTPSRHHPTTPSQFSVYVLSLSRPYDYLKKYISPGRNGCLTLQGVISLAIITTSPPSGAAIT
jgi:hypothetical protein